MFDILFVAGGKLVGGKAEVRDGGRRPLDSLPTSCGKPVRFARSSTGLGTGTLRLGIPGKSGSTDIRCGNRLRDVPAASSSFFRAGEHDRDHRFGRACVDAIPPVEGLRIGG